VIRRTTAAAGVAIWTLTSPVGLLLLPDRLALDLWLLGPAAGGVLIGLAAAGRPRACWAAVALLAVEWIVVTLLIHEAGKLRVGGVVLVNGDWLVLTGGAALAVAFIVPGVRRSE
jgi:hypothetical protein